MDTSNCQDMCIYESEILEQLDLGYKNIPSIYFPKGEINDIKYNFFLDLENGYLSIAGSRIHLYADSLRWAIVFETNGYHNRKGDSEIQLYYFGNCINYSVEKYPDRNYITNTSQIILIEPEEFKRISINKDSDIETFEMINSSISEVKIRTIKVKIEHDPNKYEALGINLSDRLNSKKLVSFDNLLRYFFATNPVLINASEKEIRQHIPMDIPKLMTINDFHYESLYQNHNLPSNQETYQMIAKVIVTRDTAFWKPTLPSNNHWKNWKSGSL